MAYLNTQKLNIKFEDWLDAKILKLKAEGVIESDPEVDEDEDEDEDEEEVDQSDYYTQEENQVHGGKGESLTWFQEYQDYPQVKSDFDKTQLFDEIIEKYAYKPTGASSDGYDTLEEIVNQHQEEYSYDMATVSTGGKIQLHEEEEGEDRRGSGDNTNDEHFSTAESAPPGDYYQLTWEGDEEEADIFDREEYQLGHGSRPIGHGADSGSGGVVPSPPQYTEPYNRHLDNHAAITTQEATNEGHVYTHKGKRGPSTMGGLVLGLQQGDVKVAYTRLGEGASRQRSISAYSDDQSMPEQRQFENEWNFNVQDSRNLPDPRFSIADKPGAPRDVQMMQFPPARSMRGEKNHFRSARVRDADWGNMHSSSPGDVVRNTAGGSTVIRGNISLPMDTVEMTMDSDDDDIIEDDVGSELSPDTARIITVDQATLIQQWRSKSARTRYAIIAALALGIILGFSLITYLIVHILSTAWTG